MISRMLVARPPGVFQTQDDDMSPPFARRRQRFLHVSGGCRTDRPADLDHQRGSGALLRRQERGRGKLDGGSNRPQQGSPAPSSRHDSLTG